jgi:hypothetical protein
MRSAAACVIAQQYSSANFSLPFHTRKEKFSTLLNKVIIPSFTLSKLRTPEFD